MPPGPPPHAQGVSSQSVVVRQYRYSSVRPPQYLNSHTRPVVELSIRLPSVHKPWLDLQLSRRKHLHSHSVEEPWGVRRNVRRLISPIVEVVITEQPDVGHENSRIDIDPMQRVEVISAIRLRQVSIRIVQVPLSPRQTRIVPRSHR